MIVGSGLLASAFHEDYADRQDVVIFASGVSNSSECDSNAFERERILLERAMESGRKLVYFSTCSLLDPELADTPYVCHKRHMEALVHSAPTNTVFRLPQVVGKTPNQHTLTNYLFARITNNEPFRVWLHAKRNLVDVADVARIAAHMLDGERCDGETINIANSTSVSIENLVQIFESVLDKKAVYSIVEAGGAYDINVDRSIGVARYLGLIFDGDYVQRLIRKYYG